MFVMRSGTRQIESSSPATASDRPPTIPGRKYLSVRVRDHPARAPAYRPPWTALPTFHILNFFTDCTFLMRACRWPARIYRQASTDHRPTPSLLGFPLSAGVRRRKREYLEELTAYSAEGQSPARERRGAGATLRRHGLRSITAVAASQLFYMKSLPAVLTAPAGLNGLRRARGGADVVSLQDRTLLDGAESG
jgi:hypothetical protein